MTITCKRDRKRRAAYVSRDDTLIAEIYPDDGETLLNAHDAFDLVNTLADYQEATALDTDTFETSAVATALLIDQAASQARDYFKTAEGKRILRKPLRKTEVPDVARLFASTYRTGIADTARWRRVITRWAKTHR